MHKSKKTLDRKERREHLSKLHEKMIEEAPRDASDIRVAFTPKSIIEAGHKVMEQEWRKHNGS